MKILLASIILSISLSTCGSKEDKVNTDTESDQSSQEMVSDEKEQDDKILLNKITKEQLMEEPYAKWYQPTYDEFTLEEDTREGIKNTIRDYQITVFMGTWCEDSQRVVPKFYKLLRLTNYPLSRLNVYAMDEDKTTPENLEKGMDIDYVPTIIFSKNGKEVNRFVELAQESLAEDILAIVSGKDYKNSYAE